MKLLNSRELAFVEEKQRHIKKLRKMIMTADDPLAFISALLSTVAAVLSTTETPDELEQVYRAVDTYLRSEVMDMISMPEDERLH